MEIHLESLRLQFQMYFYTNPHTQIPMKERSRFKAADPHTLWFKIWPLKCCKSYDNYHIKIININIIIKINFSNWNIELAIHFRRFFYFNKLFQIKKVDTWIKLRIKIWRCVVSFVWNWNIYWRKGIHMLHSIF